MSKLVIDEFDAYLRCGPLEGWPPRWVMNSLDPVADGRALAPRRWIAATVPK